MFILIFFKYIIINKVTKKVKQEPGLVIANGDINSSKTNDYSK